MSASALSIRLSVLGAAVLAGSAAHAHPGDHSVVSTWAQLLRHLLEPDHLIFLLLAGLAGSLAVFAARRRMARVRARVQAKQGDQR